MSSWDAYFEQLSQLVFDIERRKLEETEALMHLKECVDISLQSLHLLTFSSEVPTEILEEISNQLQILYQMLHRDIIRNGKDAKVAVLQIKPSSSVTDGPGRPKLIIPEDSLLHFRELGYSWTEIASVLMVSRWTLRRRVDEYGIQEAAGFSTISDDELDSHIRNFQSIHGIYVGRSMATGYLKSLGLRVQQKRVGKALVRVDPKTSKIRWACLIKRRKYQVPGPNSLWHADGHHSLISWGFVIHGAIDGYSRLIVYLKCTTNNYKETVLSLFTNAIETYGTPSRLRTDKGGENILLWNLIELLRGPNRGSYLAGSSTHNQRIERLWRDVWMYVCYLFYYTFQAMEIEGILTMSNPVHVFILHYVYKVRINEVLESFMTGWNKHPVRTERNWSPEKLWSNGMIDLRNLNQVQVAEVQSNDIGVDDLTWFGFDPHAPSPTDNGFEQVEVEDAECLLTDEQLSRLRDIDITRTSSNFGIDIFLEALASVS